MNHCVAVGPTSAFERPGSSTEHVTVPIAYVRTLLSEVESRGYSSRRFLDEMGIESGELEQVYFPAMRYGKMYQRAMSVLQDEWFGLISGGRVHRGSFRMLSLCALHCESLRQSITRSQEFCQLCRGFKIGGQLVEAEGMASVQLAPLDFTSRTEFKAIVAAVKPVHIHTTLAAWHHFYSWLIGSSIPLKTVRFTFSAGQLTEEMARLSADKMLFDQPCNGFEFSSDCLNYPVVQTEKSLEKFLQQAPFNLFIEVEEVSSLSTKIRGVLSQNLGVGMPSAEQVSSRLNMSSTKMRRILKQEGTSFQKLKDQSRKDAAIYYLKCPDVSNREVADILGYDEISGFFRAFKKWTGLTPGQFRENLPCN